MMPIEHIITTIVALLILIVIIKIAISAIKTAFKLAIGGILFIILLWIVLKFIF